MSNFVAIERKYDTFSTNNYNQQYSNYKQELNKSEKNLKMFYIIVKGFPTKTYNKIRDDEIFYMHCLRFYMQMITKILQEHGP